MKKQFLSLAVVLAMFSCSDNEVIRSSRSNSKKNYLPRKKLIQLLRTSLESTGDFNWGLLKMLHTIWSAVKHGDDILTIGYGTSKK